MLYYDEKGQPALEIVFCGEVDKIPEDFYKNLCHGKIASELFFSDNNLVGVNFSYRESGGNVTLGCP